MCQHIFTIHYIYLIRGINSWEGLLPRYLALCHRSTGLGRAGHGTGVYRGRTPALTRVSIEDNLFENVCQAVFYFLVFYMMLPVEFATPLCINLVGNGCVSDTHFAPPGLDKYRHYAAIHLSPLRGFGKLHISLSTSGAKGV